MTMRQGTFVDAALIAASRLHQKQLLAKAQPFFFSAATETRVAKSYLRQSRQKVFKREHLFDVVPVNLQPSFFILVKQFFC
jgi:hypothetical protein